jgi:hypothetical protein
LNAPSDETVAVRVSPVSKLFNVTVAWDAPAPELSSTTPRKSPVIWANAKLDAPKMKTPMAFNSFFIIVPFTAVTKLASNIDNLQL